MFGHYLKTMYRNFRKLKAYSFINIFGLSMGLACAILIFLFIQDELAYDGFHKNLNTLYRPVTYLHNPDGSVRWQGGAVQFPQGPALKEFFPEVKRFSRVYALEFIVKIKDTVENQRITLADKDFFEMFAFPLIKGNSVTALSEINSLVLSESYARKYFGMQDPIGETFTIIYRNSSNDFTVVGVAEDPPPNSTVTYDMVINFESVRLFGLGEILTSWGSLASGLVCHEQVAAEFCL